MHPEMSLVLLLVLSGVGQGIFIFLVILDALLMSSGGLSPEIFYSAGGASLIFTLLGMTASIFHLGNPLRGWKAIIRWKSSWLSREVLALSFFFGAAFLYVALYYLGSPELIRIIFGSMGVIGSLALYLSSSMLYAKVRFIREWSNVFSVINFLLFGILSGGAVFYFILRMAQPAPAISATFNYALIALGLVSLVSKIFAYRFNAKVYSPVAAKHAIMVNDPNIRLMDTGCSYDHYNTVEYNHPHSKKQNRMQQNTALFIAFLLPLLLWIVVAVRPEMVLNTPISAAAAGLVIIGLMIERRLFFIQGNHVQNLYYNNFRINNVKNPLLRKRR